MTIPEHGKGLGLIESVDMRDALYPMRLQLERIEGPVREYRYWDRGETLNQGSEGACVGFGWAAWYNCKPRGFYAQKGNDYGFSVYHRAQELDEWPGTDYSGTSVRAGARVMLEEETLTSYLWAASSDEIRAWIKAYGPVVVGHKWLRSMDRPRASDGMLVVDPASGVRGGHCTMLYAVSASDDVLGQNSWGDDWGKEGSYKLDKAGLETLIRIGGYTACTAAQTGLGTLG